MEPISYKGTRWFKCDLHVHTPASRCFQDNSVTPEDWVARAIYQGLDCVAVTDHNTGDWIDRIKIAARSTNLTIFPGVEITCDTSKIHLLVLFDITKTTSDVNDFLIRCGIDRNMFADQSANTSKNIFEVAELAFENQALVIPAHIDEFNGLGQISFDNINKFFDLPYINAVQVVHERFTSPNLMTNNNVQLKEYINAYYSNPNVIIDYGKIGEWYRSVKLAMGKKMALLTFSDNPHELHNPKHGLFGMGMTYTWIKMDIQPSLEGLRQAFLLPEFRVKSKFISAQAPYRHPELWFKSVEIKNTSLNEPNIPLTINFSPQLNTIIGGRGSGKSSILRFIRGLFNRTDDIENLTEIIRDHNDFYKITDNRSQKGVFDPDSRIDIEFVRNDVIYKISATDINNASNQTIRIQKFDNILGRWQDEEAAGFIEFFKFEQYSQKQIYEIAQEPNALRERIDKSIVGLNNLINDREILKTQFFEKSASIRTIRLRISNKAILQTEIRDLEERMAILQRSGISELLQAKQTFSREDNIINEFIEEIGKKEISLENTLELIENPAIDPIPFDQFSYPGISDLVRTVSEGISEIKADLRTLHSKIGLLKSEFESGLYQTQWKQNYIQNSNDFEARKSELLSEGIDDISNFEILLQQKISKESELSTILGFENRLEIEIQELNEINTRYLLKLKAITRERQSFVGTVLRDDKIQVTISPFRNKTDFISKLRSILQRPNGFETDLESLSSICFQGNAEAGTREVKEIFYKIRRGESADEVNGHFINLVGVMSPSQMDEIELMWPEDDIAIKYKPSGSDIFKPLATASAGQKTTVILTLILSYGNIPLLLDQPEDDLDNRLVYELIVDRLKLAKNTRQIIIVTHNANIPVNGDAEYVLSMNSETRHLSVLCEGTVEHSVIKKEICDVMEGSEQAFDMRSKRYKDTR